MKVDIYEIPETVFQIGWNVALTATDGPISLTLTVFDLWDFEAGYAAAIHKQQLPERWLA